MHPFIFNTTQYISIVNEYSAAIIRFVGYCYLMVYGEDKRGAHRDNGTDNTAYQYSLSPSHGLSSFVVQFLCGLTLQHYQAGA
jgi:hypothetical protein